MTTDAPETEQGRRPFPTLKVLIALGVLATLAILGGILSIPLRVEAIARSAEAEADRLDPGWRLRDLEARREVLPDESNGALLVAEVLDALPDDWKTTPPKSEGPPDWSQLQGMALYDALPIDPPNVLLTEEQADAVRAESDRIDEALDLARTLVQYPKGRNEIAWKPNLLNIPLPHAQNGRNVARLLDFDVTARIQDGDADGALESCHALLNVGRSLGDEPFIISQLVRIAESSFAVRAVMRTLARGEPSEGALASMQGALTEEFSEPILLHGLRGDRAIFHELFSRLDRGELTLAELGDEPWSPSVMIHKGHLMYRYNQGLCLSFINRAIAIGKKPVHEQPPLWAQWRADTSPKTKSLIDKLSGAMAYLLVPSMDAFAQAQDCSRARLGACVVTIAAERYRRARGRWPESIEPIEEALAITLPQDPCVPHPFRLKRTVDGLLVYSVGPDGLDDGGNLTIPKRLDAKNYDIGFRLWDVPQRRRLP